MSRFGRTLTAFSAVIATCGVVACVDIFHSTDALTRCDIEGNASGCGEAGVTAPTDAGADTSLPESDTGTDASLPEICSPTTAAAKTRAIETCAALSTCEHGLGGSAFGACFRDAMQAYDCTSFPNRKLVKGSARYAFWACMTTARTCGAVQACVYPDEPQRGCPGGGNVATACGSGNKARTSCPVETLTRPPGESCAAQGQSCIQIDPYVTKCVGAAQRSCSAGAQCAGPAVVRCIFPADVDGAVDVGFRCDDRGGGNCAVGSEGPACLPSGPACSATAGAVCNGSSAAACIGGKEERVACAALNAICVDSPGFADPIDLCQADPLAGQACVDGEECVGSELVSCVRGVSYRLSCVGRGTCKTATIDGRQVAYCSDTKP